MQPPKRCRPVDQVGGRFSALLDLPGEEKPSSNLADASSQPEEDLLGDEEGPSSDLADASCGPSQHKEPEDLPRKERAIRKCLFWPDGTSKICTRVQIANREHEKIRRLVEALLDKQNDDQDREDELKDIVHWQSIGEGAGKLYYHLNITVKTKGAADDAGSANLFFVEVACDRNAVRGYFINTFLMVNTDSKGDEVICHGCINNGSTDMKHAPAGSFKGGLEDIRFPFNAVPCNEKQWLDSNYSEEQNLKRIKDEESRIRKTFDYLDDAVFLENLRNKRLHYCPY